MGCPGFQEGFLIVVVLAVVMGWGRLPKIAEGLGRAVRDFQRGLKEGSEIDVTPKKLPDTDDDEPGAKADRQ